MMFINQQTTELTTAPQNDKSTAAAASATETDWLIVEHKPN